MVGTHDREDAEREFDMLMTMQNIIVVPDRRAGAVACYQELKHLTTLLRQPRRAASEPSNVYSLNGHLRSIGTIL